MRQEAWARGRGCVSLSTIRLQGPAVSQQGVAKGFIPVSELCLQLFWLLLSPSCLQSQCSVTLTSSPAMALHNSSLSAPIETAVSPALCSPGAQCQCCPGSLSLSPEPPSLLLTCAPPPLNTVHLALSPFLLPTGRGQLALPQREGTLHPNRPGGHDAAEGL